MSQIVVELPAHHKGLADALMAASKALSAAERGTTLGRSVDMVAVEDVAGERAAALELAFLEQFLRCLDVDAKRVMIGGRLHARVGRYPGSYPGFPGVAVVERSLYRPLGERNAPTVDPVALRAGLVQGNWLPGAARAMAHRLTVGTSREAEAMSKLEKRLPYSHASFEKIGHAVGAAVVAERADIEQVLIDTATVPEGTQSVAIALDRSSMAFEEPRKRPRGRPRKDAPKRPISRVYRMAWSGTVTFNDGDGKVLDTIHYGREPTFGHMLAETLVSDVLAIRSRHPGLPIVILCDGAHELWNLLEPLLEGVDDVTSTLDYWHLIEKLAAAARVMDGESKKTVARWKAALLNRTAAADNILAELRATGLEHVQVGKDRPVHEAITYIDNHADRMRYRHNRRRGLPIGSGPVEANAKSLYIVRMKRPGARWKYGTADHVLQLRAHALTGRFADAVSMALPKPVAVRRAS
ncbi:MAG TPA: ISKra4 family transposase [Planctomycetes bacterium]|nr:ISKra4 family transposase [Planctomycetota bacterium]